MRSLAFAAALVATPLLAAESASELPGWMAGGWEMRQGEQWVDEYWTPPRGGMMNGASRTGTGDELQFWEQVRIVRKPDGGLSYIAMPQGGPAVEFAMINSGPNSIEFANPAHDYPQRIKYWREGRELKAEISLSDGSNANSWSYRQLRTRPRSRN